MDTFLTDSSLAICKICGAERDSLTSHLLKTHRISTKEYLFKYPNSAIVSSRIRQAISVSMVGKSHTSVHNDNVSKSLKNRLFSLEWRRKLSLSHSGVPLSESHNRNAVVARTGLKRSEKSIQNLRKAWISPGRASKNWKRYTFHSHKNGQEISLQSSLELQFARIAEDSCNVSKYARPNFSIPYLDVEGGTRSYHPDFVVTLKEGLIFVVEIKSLYYLKDPNNQYKFIAAKKFCESNNYVFLVLTENELGDTNARHPF